MLNPEIVKTFVIYKIRTNEKQSTKTFVLKIKPTLQSTKFDFADFHAHYGILQRRQFRFISNKINFLFISRDMCLCVNRCLVTNKSLSSVTGETVIQIFIKIWSNILNRRLQFYLRNSALQRHFPITNFFFLSLFTLLSFIHSSTQLLIFYSFVFRQKQK